MEDKKIYSWIIKDEYCIEKNLDLTFYNSGSTGIPKNLRNYFEIGEKNLTTLSKIFWYKGKSYNVKIEFYGKDHKRTRLFINELYKENVVTIKKNNKMLIKKIDSQNYTINFFSDKDNLNNFDEELTSYFISDYKEGKKLNIYTTKYERNPKIRRSAIKIHGTKCEICGFDFEKKYGALGKNYIEVHHINPLCMYDSEHSINPKTDLICVCSNCHKMLHRNRNRIMTPEELRDCIKNNRKENEKNDLFR